MTKNLERVRHTLELQTSRREASLGHLSIKFNENGLENLILTHLKGYKTLITTDFLSPRRIKSILKFN